MLRGNCSRGISALASTRAAGKFTFCNRYLAKLDNCTTYRDSYCRLLSKIAETFSQCISDGREGIISARCRTRHVAYRPLRGRPYMIITRCQVNKLPFIFSRRRQCRVWRLKLRGRACRPTTCINGARSSLAVIGFPTYATSARRNDAINVFDFQYCRQ